MAADPGGYEPRLHDTVLDTETEKVGRVMALGDSRAWLRPLGGGREWHARTEHLQPVPAAEALRKGVAAVNARSRGEQP